MNGKDKVKVDEGTATHAEFSRMLHVPLELPRVTWWKHPGLRKLYLMMPILFLGMDNLSGIGRLLIAVTELCRILDQWIRWLAAELITDYDTMGRLLADRASKV